MRVLGVDPGSVITGFGVIEETKGRLALIEQGAIRTGRGDDLATRLETIYLALVEVIARSRPDVAAVESPFAGLNARSLIQLSHARGVVLLAARVSGLPVYEYAPRAVKSAVVGYGGAEKGQVGKMVQLLLPSTRELKLAPDASDAIAIAICHAHSHRLTGLRAR
jgi:crossover junction endodeoxyribonuclease RuvC